MVTKSDQPIDVQHSIDTRGLSWVQILLIVLCFLVVTVDGFDTAAIGVIAPAIRIEWSVTPAWLASLFGASLFGLMIGALAFGPLADRLGRRAMLTLSVFFFGVASLASPFAPSIGILVLLRFVTGLGLGGAMPNAVTLTSEYSPEARRSFLLMLMLSGFSLGAAVGGMVAAYLLAEFGWRSVLRIPSRSGHADLPSAEDRLNHHESGSMDSSTLPHSSIKFPPRPQG